MTSNGITSNLLDGGASTNAWQKVKFVNTSMNVIKVVIANNHASYVIDYYVTGQMRITGAEIDEVASSSVPNIINGADYAELDVDPGFAVYNVYYRTSVTGDHSDDIDIDYSGRTG